MLPPVRVKTCPDPRWGILAPFLAVLLIVGGTGIFVRVYHGSIEGDHKLDPAFPRAGRPFRIMIPPGSSGKKAATLLLVVTKESRSPYAPGRWPVPSTVMRLVLADSPDPRPVILSLDDPGLYQIRIIETSSGMSRLSRKVRVVLPASFLGDTLLLSTLALAGTGTAILAGRRMAFQIGTKRRLMLILFLDLSALFVFGSLAEVPERRIEAIPLAFGNAPPTEGLLSLREQVWQGGAGTWDSIGHDRLLFQGPIVWGAKITPPLLSIYEPGLLRTTVALPRQRGPRLRILRKFVRIRQDNPSEKMRDLCLFLGLVFFSALFFVGNLPLRNNASKSPE